MPRQSMNAIRRRPLAQSRVPLGIHLRLRRRRRLLHGFHLAASNAHGGLGGEAWLLGQPKGDRAEVLHAIQAYFGCGCIRPDRSDRTLKWETRRLEDLLEHVVPHFEAFPLLSGKRYDCERFAAVCRLMSTGAHRRRDGLAEIVELARMMNPSGRRRYDAEALLAQLRQGEGIVCASGDGGFTRSSDLHEWRND